MSFVVGFDLSLTAPAAVAIPLNWRPGDWKRVKSWVEYPKAPKSDNVPGQLRRYRTIADWACGVIGRCGRTPVLAVEQYAFSKNNSQASKLMELGGVVRLAVFERFGFTMTVVSTSSARKLLLGQVPKFDPKGHTMAAIFKAGAPKTWDDNVCDACCCCNWMLSELGGKCLGVAGG